MGQKLEPNPYSPYADADPEYRHLVPEFLGICPQPGVLAIVACGGLAVVPETLTELPPGPSAPPGLCPACLTAAHGGLGRSGTPGRCSECGDATGHGKLCALCRQEKHDAWWASR